LSDHASREADLPDHEDPGWEQEIGPSYHIAEEITILWWASEILRAAVLSGLTFFADSSWLPKLPDWPFSAGQISIFVIPLIVLRALLYPSLAFRSWRFGIRSHDVWLRYGVFWRVRRSVPRVRIQHVDIQSGPLERLRGLSNLVIYTAGTGDADAKIPGLHLSTAEWLRDQLLPKQPPSSEPPSSEPPSSEPVEEDRGPDV